MAMGMACAKDRKSQVGGSHHPAQKGLISEGHLQNPGSHHPGSLHSLLLGDQLWR